MKGKLKDYILDIIETRTKRITALALFLSAFFCKIIIEIFNSRSVLKGAIYLFRDPFSFIINFSIIMFTLSFCLLLKRRLAYILTVSTIWLGFGIANFVVTSKRVTPFSATDLKLLDSIDDIIGKYLNSFELVLIIISIVAVAMIVVIIWIKFPKYAEKIKYGRNVLLVLATSLIMVIIIKLGFAFSVVSQKFPNMTIAYHDYGFPYCFVCSLLYHGVEEPSEYSEQAVKDVLDTLDNMSTVDGDNKKTPNVIFLQLESFFDVSKMKNLELSSEALPNFNQLKEKYPSGYLTVNNVGYGTANTEFEIMTGLNLDNFGPGEFPYKTILKTSTCESAAYILKEYGYSTHAIHNNTATFYGRRDVFTRLGYDSFTSVEYMNPKSYTVTDWVKDDVLTEEIMKALQSTDEMDYIYTISVQGHGDYPKESVLENPAITVVGGYESQEEMYMWEYYVNMIHEMDVFIGDLIKALEAYGEDTVLVMYGDHLPSLDIQEKELENGDLYETEYIVWSNFELDMPDKDIETYQLSSRVLQYLNIDGGLINKYHQAYNDKNDYLDKLHLLTYDILYGNMYAYEGISPYVEIDMKLGTYDIVIEDVRLATYGEMLSINPDYNWQDDVQSEDIATEPNASDAIDNWYIIKGENFTNCSFVFVNGSEYETKFVDENTLMIYEENLESLDVINITQKSNSTILTSSEPFTYFNVNDLIEGSSMDGSAE